MSSTRSCAWLCGVLLMFVSALGAAQTTYSPPPGKNWNGLSGEYWKNAFPDATFSAKKRYCNDQRASANGRQSPIHLSAPAWVNVDLRDINFSGYSGSKSGKLENNGHSVELKFE